MLKTILLIGTGGFIGSVARFLVSNYFTKHNTSLFPFGTFTVNVTGCFLIGLIYALAEKQNLISNDARLFLATGLCGGFTTFSTFGYENIVLLKDDQLGYSLLYIGASVMAGLFFTYLGSLTVKFIGF